MTYFDLISVMSKEDQVCRTPAVCCMIMESTAATSGADHLGKLGQDEEELLQHK